MSRLDGLSQWHTIVSTHMPHLSRAHAHGLALWSYGMVLAQSCGITTVAALLAALLDHHEGTLRQRLREWCYEAKDKRGAQRQAVDVIPCFAALLRWVLAWWPSDEPRLVLAMDATTVGQRFTVLAVSVVYRGCAIPVAWQIVVATRKGAWRPHWVALFDHVQGSVPASWTVLVVADRGLYARWLFTHLVGCGWHPLLRINQGGKVRPQGQARFRPLASVAPSVGTAWQGRVTCFVTREAQLECTLLARWDVGYSEAWLLLTDLAPDVAQVAWYGMRSWIEGGFKDLTRGGWHWEQTTMRDPQRAMRLWLAMAVATLWVVSVGGEADATLPASSLDALPGLHIARRRASGRARPRLISCFRRGVVTILATLLRGNRLPAGRFIPEPWPTLPPTARRPSPRAILVGAISC